VRVSIQSLVSEKAFGVIFAVRVDDRAHTAHGRKLRVKATSAVMVGRPVVGETWEIEGGIQETRWGPPGGSYAAVRALPTGWLIRGYLAAHVPGVGQERAKALWDRFGEDLTRVLDRPDHLHLIAETLAPARPLLGSRLAGACQAAWREARSETLTMEWLSARGIEDLKAARTILRVHGDNAITRPADNPYCLVPLIRGHAWTSWVSNCSQRLAPKIRGGIADVWSALSMKRSSASSRKPPPPSPMRTCGRL
jgi:exodeoxyribonuclease V alpha subunit